MSIYRRLAQRITVADLQDPLGPSLTMDMDFDEAGRVTDEAHAKYGYEPFDRTSLVLDERGTPTHFCWTSAVNETVRAEAEPLDLSMMLSGDTTALSAVKLFGTSGRSIAFVLHENAITGVLCEAGFFKLEFAMCVLAMLLEVERTCLDVALRDPESSWTKLNPERQAKARAVYSMRNRRDSADATPYSLLQCTTFIDKQTLIESEPEVVALGKEWLRDFF